MKYLHACMLSLLSFFCHESYGVVMIPLGFNCTVAGVLGNLGFRKIAYPFDWMISSYEAVYNSIADDFQHFLDPNTIQIASDKSTVIDLYGLKFVHDFPTIHQAAAVHDEESVTFAEISPNWRQSLAVVQEKYQRRIKRLKDVLTGSEPVLFIRYQMSKNEAIYLRDLLLQRYPQLNFTVIAVGDSPTVALDWGLEKIRNFSVAFWGDDAFASWKIIFSTLGVEPHQTRIFVEDDDMPCGGTCHFLHELNTRMN